MTNEQLEGSKGRQGGNVGGDRWTPTHRREVLNETYQWGRNEDYVRVAKSDDRNGINLAKT